MKQTVFFLSFALLMAPSALMTQSSSLSAAVVAEDPGLDAGTGLVPAVTPNPPANLKPLSRIAFGGGVSPLGIQLQVATNLNQHYNLRTTGNIFSYSTNFTTNGFAANAKLSLSSAGTALDIYPFHAGFRISPGLLFYNGNRLSASTTTAAGTSFTLNNQTFYSAYPNGVTGATPVNGNATLGLNAIKPAFTITTGWGNMIPGKGGHWSFPFEIGVALIGTPAVNVNLGGWVCLDQAQTQCADFASTANPIGAAAQAALQAQTVKWKSDLDPLKTYPIVSAGVAYNIKIR
jgi:hypothetical protein